MDTPGQGLERTRIEAALRAAHGETERQMAQSRAIFDHLSDGLVVADLEGMVYHWNPAALRMHGFADLSECRRRLPEFAEIFELSTPDGRVLPLDEWPLARILSGETLRDLEVVVRRRGADWRRVFLYGGTLARDAGEFPLLAVVSITDITERKLEEQKLRRLNRTLRALSDSNQAVMRAADEIEYVQTVCRIVVEDCGYAMTWVGYADEDEARTVRPVASAGFAEGYLETLAITWADNERGRGPTGTAIRTGRPCGCRNMLTDPAFAPWRDEAIRRGYASSLVLPLRGGERIFGAISIYAKEPGAFADADMELLSELADDLARGITILRLRRANERAEEALRRSELEAREHAARLSAVLDATPSVIWIAEDADCRSIRGNRFAQRMLRMASDANMSKSQETPETVRHFRVRRDGTDLAPEEMPMQRVAATGRALNDYALDLAFEDGEVRSLLGNVAPLLDADGSPAGAIGAFVDITERRSVEEELRLLNEQLEQRVKDRTARLQVLASELTLAEERERRRLALLLHDHLQQSLAAAKLHLTALAHGMSEKRAEPLRQIEAMLADAIQSSRTLSVELSPPILYEDGLAGALQWLARNMKEKHRLDVVVEADPSANPISQPVYVLLFQSARELLFNVAKHAGVDRATVRLECGAGGRANLTIADEGRGFDAAAVLGEDGAGKGLGLMSIRERLEAVDGTLEIESAPGRGSLVLLSAPRALPEHVPAEPHAPRGVETEAAAAAPPRSEEGRIRILLADDHEVVRQGLARLLEGEGDMIVVGEASNGREATELAARLAPDVVVMDMRMPEMNGVEAARRILGARPQTRVIGLSMHEEPEVAQQMLAAGAAVYMHKASPAEMLLAAIRGSGAPDRS
jgi:signal transduction histidine kinase/ActR/RegA family two-component response regulator